MENFLVRHLTAKHYKGLIYSLLVLAVLVNVVLYQKNVREIAPVINEIRDEVLLFNHEVMRVEKSGEVTSEQKKLMFGYLNSIGEDKLDIVHFSSDRDKELYLLLGDRVEEADNVVDAKIIDIVSDGNSYLTTDPLEVEFVDRILITLLCMVLVAFFAMLTGRLYDELVFRDGVRELIKEYKGEIEALRVVDVENADSRDQMIVEIEEKIRDLEDRLK